MKWKLTNRFLMTVLSIVFIVILLNMIILVGFLYYKSTDRSNSSAGEVVIRAFEQYVTIEDEEFIVSEEGLTYLDEHSAWIQVLDRNGNVVKSYLTNNLPLKDHYSPVELINTYKYRDIDHITTTYISEIEPYSILMGVRDSSITRNVFTMDNDFVIATISQYLLIILIADIFVALIVGLLFGSILTKPLYHMIEYIQRLKNRNFILPKYKRPGIYKNVFENLQDVSTSLEQQESERNKLEKMRNEWVTNVSHDMKTPLASIRGYSELLLDETVSDEERKNYASVIERQSKYMHELLDDFALTTRLRNAELPLEKTQVNIDSFVRNIVIDFLNDAQFSDYTISFVPANMQQNYALDAHLMKRAILNFLTNACVHNSKDTEIQVIVSETDFINISIIDFGKGISEEDLPNIFERYYRGTNTSNIKGSGLGMAISRDIIEAHDGKVSIESKKHHGTSITISLPKKQ
jgi:signal transduction histidine kinase